MSALTASCCCSFAGFHRDMVLSEQAASLRPSAPGSPGGKGAGRPLVCPPAWHALQGTQALGQQGAAEVWTSSHSGADGLCDILVPTLLLD